MKAEGDSFAPAEPVHLFTATSDIQDYDVGANGELVLAQGDRATSALPLTVLLDWQEGIEKK